MCQLENDMVAKWEIVELKLKVLSMLHGLQFDGLYNTKDCINDLNELLETLDQSEAPIYLILKNNPDTAMKEAYSIGNAKRLVV